MRYSEERKEAVLRKLLPRVSKRDFCAHAVRLAPESASDVGWTAQNKFAAVVETARMNAEERTEYCRSYGLHPEQIQAWRCACEQAHAVTRATRESQQKIWALAEAAARLVLAKKVGAILGKRKNSGDSRSAGTVAVRRGNPCPVGCHVVHASPNLHALAAAAGTPQPLVGRRTGGCSVRLSRAPVREPGAGADCAPTGQPSPLPGPGDQLLPDPASDRSGPRISCICAARSPACFTTST